jgi:hypothetical protein
MKVGSVLVACLGVEVLCLFCSRHLYRLRNELLVPVANGMCCLLGLLVDAMAAQAWWVFCLLLPSDWLLLLVVLLMSFGELKWLQLCRD